MWKEPRKRPHDCGGAIRGITVPHCETGVGVDRQLRDGFPFSYELFDGPRRMFQPSKAILRTVERKLGKHGAVLDLFDRGVVSERPGGHPQARGRIWWAPRAASSSSSNQELLKDDFEKIRPEVESSKITIPGGEETP